MAIKMDVVGTPLGESRHEYSWRDTALYALAVGAQEEDLDFLLESRGPRVLPTFSVIPTFRPLLKGLSSVGVPLSKILHGEQTIRLHAPLPRKGALVTTSEVGGIHDVGKHAILYFDTRSHLEGEEDALFETRWTIVVRGAGGFGGTRPPQRTLAEPPEDRPADLCREMHTLRTQALLYRLTGDVNPLHADPRVAKALGFERPILHGLCTYGHVGLCLVKDLAGGDPARLKTFFGRFSKEVYPGDVLTVEAWKRSETEFFVQARVGERLVLSNGHATLT